MGGSQSTPPQKPPLPPPGTPLDVNKGTFGPNRDPNKDFKKYGKKEEDGINMGWYLYHPDSRDDVSLYLPSERKEVLDTCKMMDTYFGVSEHDIAPGLDSIKTSIERLQKEIGTTRVTGEQLSKYEDGKLSKRIEDAAMGCKRLRDDYPRVVEAMNTSWNTCQRNGYTTQDHRGAKLADDCVKIEECRRLFGRKVVFHTVIRGKLEEKNDGCQLIDLLMAMKNTPAPKK
mmetsp:Transcript_24598/g.59201  ORF Transcript_24598/g.59201 Transcript_24598/m.59201 type:complete len:229 (+) Transcript_24598:193-879(+)